MSEFGVSVGRLEKLYKGKLPDWLIYLIEDGFLHTHDEKKEGKPSCQWCEKWKWFMDMCGPDGEYTPKWYDIHYLITLGKYMQVCPVCGEKL